MLQRTLPAGWIAPCLPTKTDKMPSGSEWLHEVKHDGFRVIARKKDRAFMPSATAERRHSLKRETPAPGREAALGGGSWTSHS
jgi:hypothetical protein